MYPSLISILETLSKNTQSFKETTLLYCIKMHTGVRTPVYK